MGEWWLFLLRWFHFLAGITWIGMLYYFNFVQTPFFGKPEMANVMAPVRAGMITGGLLASALWWFRWGAMVTFITGWLYLLHRFGQMGSAGFFGSDYGWKILFGGLLGSLMWFNVWFIIWPNQQVVMASAAEVGRGGKALPEAAARGARAGVTSRTNTMLSIPMLFFMGAASHLAMASGPISTGQAWAAFIFLVIVMAVVEINAVAGPATADRAHAGKKLLSTVSGTFWAGFILTAILYIGLEIIL